MLFGHCNSCRNFWTKTIEPHLGEKKAEKALDEIRNWAFSNSCNTFRKVGNQNDTLTSDEILAR